MKSFLLPLIIEYDIQFSPKKTIIFVASIMSFLVSLLLQNKFLGPFQHPPMSMLPCFPMTLDSKNI
jgi:hypothetical protein